MSIFSDYKVGALSDYEFEQACRVMNRIGRWEREHEHDDLEVDFGYDEYEENEESEDEQND